MPSVKRLRRTNDIMIFGGRNLRNISRSDRTPTPGIAPALLAALGILSLAISASASSGPGYLRAVGPAPLRFWSPPARTPEPPATNAASASASTSAAAEEPAMVPNPNPYDFMNAFGAQPPLVMEATSTSGQAPMAPIMPATTPANTSTNGQPGDVVSPQMLLEYFPNSNNNRPGKGGQTSIYVPVDANAVINQSQQPQQRPSSATYSN